MADRAAFQAAETELSLEIFSGRQRERHNHTNLVGYAGQLAADDTQKPDQAEMGIFKHGFCHQAALDELHRCQKFF